MAKNNVTGLLNDLAAKVIRENEKGIPKDPRALINARPHIYTMNYSSLVEEVTNQIKGEFAIKSATRVEIDPYRKQVIERACRTYFNAVASNMSAAAPGFSTDILEQTQNEFSIRIQSSNNTMSVYRNFIDKKRATPLKVLKNTLEIDLLLDDDDSVTSRIKGYFKNGERVGGLLDIGHQEGYSIAEKRVQFILEKLEAKALSSTKRVTKKESPLFKILAEVRVNPRLSNIKTIKFEGDILVKEQGVDSNRRVQSAKEFALVNSIKKQIEALVADTDWVNFSSSPSGIDIIRNQILSTAKKAGAKTSSKNIKPIPKSSYKTSSVIKKEVVQVSRERDSGVAIKANKKKSNRVTPKRQNWLQLLPILNSRLTPKVIANMKSPALVNRTGTFANSAKVVNAEQTREGFPTFVYDYERNPYDVFDRTKGASPWNTPDRDPRALVDKSLREIVREMAIGRFYTRRA